MPMHDWKRVPATIYHHFHQQWTISICDALNAGLLPPGYSALVEQYSSGLYPDVLAVQRRTSKPSNPRAETTTLEAPRTRMVVHPREGRFHERANRVVIRHHLGDVVCAIEVVSPGNKAGKIAIREFVSKAVDFLRRGINLLVVDPFPAGPQDPQTLHKLIWDEFDEGVPFDTSRRRAAPAGFLPCGRAAGGIHPGGVHRTAARGGRAAGHAGLAGHRSVRERAARANVQGGLGCVPGRLPAPRRTRRTAGRELAAGMRTALVRQGCQEKHAADPTIHQRFAAEAEITGGLEHPGGPRWRLSRRRAHRC